MKTFWGSFLGALTGIIVTFILAIFLFIAMIVASVSQLPMQAEKPIKVKTNSVLHIKLNHTIVERSSKNPFEDFSFFDDLKNLPLGLNDIIANIEKAKDDENIKGIYLDITSIPAGIATVEEIRNALLDFKSSEKFIVAYSEEYAQGAYYLATTADKIYLNPEGMVDFRGLNRQIMFYKNLLDKLEVNMQIFRHGKFKSAAEPFFLDKMSKENREQILGYLRPIWNHVLTGISRQRNIPIDELNRYADQMLITDAESALQYKLVDRLVYKDEMLEVLKELTGVKSENKINYVEMRKYTRAPKVKSESYTSNKIAVVYATGSIESGEGDDNTIGSEKISKALREARTDSTIKAIVLRVNSPGGSALASDVIWREMVLAKERKPVIVSMGDVAASGGYYISCAAHTIVAHPNTITGSIGVFGILPNAKNFFSNKLGITVDTANTNKHADIGSLFRPVTQDEGAVIQKWVEDVYSDFIKKVGEGRGMTVAEVDSIGQGRVWSGEDAKKIGLVDELGSLKDAIALAAKKAQLKEYKILELPKQKEPFEEIFEEIFDESMWIEKKLKQEFGSSYENYRQLKNILHYQGVHMRLPYDIVIY